MEPTYMRDTKGRFVVGNCGGLQGRLILTERIPVNLSPSPTLSYVVGVFMGDGYAWIRDGGKKFWGVGLRVQESQRAFAESFCNALKSIGLNPKLSHIKYFGKAKGLRTSGWEVRAASVVLCTWFAKLEIPEVKEIARQFPVDFLRGFYESEGSVYLRDGRTVDVEIYNNERELIELCKEIVSGMGFQSSIGTKHKGNYAPTFRLKVWGQSSRKIEFLRTLNPSVKREVRWP